MLYYQEIETPNRIVLERMARRCRAMTCSPVIGRKIMDILLDFRLWINSLRFQGIS
jgi:hypothetical protein